MTKQWKQSIGVYSLVLTLVITLYFIFNTSVLLFDGEKILDGIMIAKALFIIFFLYLLGKLSFYLMQS